ncbi:MAG: invasion associated locus B family protein [Rickettsiales bacterium]|nr:invasion associated locus B family protein [Rickettsiales bacterium]
MLRVNSYSLLVAVTIAAFSLSAKAQQLVSNHDAWRVFTIVQNGKKECYLASLPTKKRGNYTKRGEPYLLVTHKTGTTDEVSVSSGYPYKDKSEVTMTFGKDNYELFTKGELAWAYDTKADKQLVKEMMQGATLKVRGTSRKGTYSEDSYSLKGFTAAHRKMKQTCK